MSESMCGPAIFSNSAALLPWEPQSPTALGSEWNDSQFHTLPPVTLQNLNITEVTWDEGGEKCCSFPFFPLQRGTESDKIREGLLMG